MKITVVAIVLLIGVFGTSTATSPAKLRVAPQVPKVATKHTEHDDHAEMRQEPAAQEPAQPVGEPDVQDRQEVIVVHQQQEPEMIGAWESSVEEATVWRNQNVTHMKKSQMKGAF